MTTAPAGEPGELVMPDAADTAGAARVRRARLMRVLRRALTATAILIALGVGLPPEPRRALVETVCTALVLCATLPLVATFIQYSVLGVHRSFIDYAHLRAYYPRVAIIVPAWNEGSVIATTIDRLLKMEYPEDRVRVYVVDDASTDATPDIVEAWSARSDGRVVHLRREQGGQGKAHTLNFGIRRILAEPWAEAVLIMDADVLFEDSTLRRMARHLSDPGIGAVTAYIKEGTPGGNYLTRFIAYEYITAQAAARRAQNVLGALACLAGGAQLHSRENLERIGGAIDTTSLAEDTFTTFRTQLRGKRVVFDGNAIVWAEEPQDLVGLWKQRLRWARGNVQISLQFSQMWLRGRYGVLGRGLFALIWFTVLLMPLSMIGASAGLLGLMLIDGRSAWTAFQLLWIAHAVLYVFVTAMSYALDPQTARRSWVQGVVFPGVVSLAIMVYSVAPAQVGWLVDSGLTTAGITVTPALALGAQVFMAAWMSVSMLIAYAAKEMAGRWRLRWLPALLLTLAGYGAFLCSVTFAAYVREIQGATQVWDKTVKSGRVMMPR